MQAIYERVGVSVTDFRTVDHAIPPGVWPEMRAHGYEQHDFPALYRESVEPADILVIAGPIWLGDQSSQTRKIIERLYASSEVNANVQWSYYSRVGGVLTTGNEDGGKRVSAQVLYALQHIGLTVPPQSDASWTGPAGPGPSYLDTDSGGEQNDSPATPCAPPGTSSISPGCSRKPGGIPAYGNLHERLGPHPAGPPQPRVPLIWPDPGRSQACLEDGPVAMLKGATCAFSHHPPLSVGLSPGDAGIPSR